MYNVIFSKQTIIYYIFSPARSSAQITILSHFLIFCYLFIVRTYLFFCECSKKGTNVYFLYSPDLSLNQNGTPTSYTLILLCAL